MVRVHMKLGEHASAPLHPSDVQPEFTLSEQEWKERLTPLEYSVLRQSATEPRFTYQEDSSIHGKENPGEKVIYACKACHNHLFSSEHKFESHCGWPSFYSALAGKNIIERTDTSHGMTRTEVLCAKCHSHLGHVFQGEKFDTPTDLRYCINSVCLLPLE